MFIFLIKKKKNYKSGCSFFSAFNLKSVTIFIKRYSYIRENKSFRFKLNFATIKYTKCVMSEPFFNTSEELKRKKTKQKRYNNESDSKHNFRFRSFNSPASRKCKTNNNRKIMPSICCWHEFLIYSFLVC